MCSKPTKVTRWNSAPSEGNAIEVAMNVYGRQRECTAGHTFKTVEMDAAELSALRRKAYLHELAEARMTVREQRARALQEAA